ncbi:MAG TPA: 16S rRNA (uracil(1498)-N(3))-methyltransferase [Nevskiaceae bacterium]
MTRIHLPQALDEGQLVELPPSAARHVLQVLRLGVGAPLTLFNGEGGEYAAELLSVDRRKAVARVGAWRGVERESPLALTLAQCVSRGERMDYTIQKAVELGVRQIAPLISERTVVQIDARRWARRSERWRGVIAAACEQCGRNRLPELSEVRQLAAWLRPAAGLRLVLDPDDGVPLASLRAPAAVTLLVGPEGGLSADELALARRCGCVSVRLGPRVLRTETAGVAASAAMQALWGDWR